MEPPVAVADFRDGKVIAWAAVQHPQAAQETVAAALEGGEKAGEVVCHLATSSAPQPAYISAVSISVMPRSRPERDLSDVSITRFITAVRPDQNDFALLAKKERKGRSLRRCLA